MSRVDNMNAMFRGAKSFQGDISKWDMSTVTDMYRLFGDAISFNGDISKSDVYGREIVQAAAIWDHLGPFNGNQESNVCRIVRINIVDNEQFRLYAVHQDYHTALTSIEIRTL